VTTSVPPDGMKDRLTALDWIEQATALQPRTEAFIDGRFVPAASGRTFLGHLQLGPCGSAPSGIPDPRANRTRFAAAGGEMARFGAESGSNSRPTGVVDRKSGCPVRSARPTGIPA
jgi:hypothetical protein